MMQDETPDFIVIGLCTFRRASVVATLQSLAHLVQVPGTVCRIVVADNDEGPEAQRRVADAAAHHALPICYLHAPARNISIARNAILNAAHVEGARYLAFLDDDETVGPEWLSALMSRMRQGDCAAVLGPVRADYEVGAPVWMQRGVVHDTLPVTDRTGTILSGYTCNVLLDLTAPSVAGLSFDPTRGRSGGEDTAFFHALREKGGVIAFAAEALASETVPPNRATLSWLLKRRYRMGQTHGSLLAQGKGIGRRWVEIARASGKALICAGLAATRIGYPLRRNQALMRAALHIGAVASLNGQQTVILYGLEPAQVLQARPIAKERA